MDVIQAIRAASREDFKNNHDRLCAIRECQGLLVKLQTPFERVWEAVVDYPALTASIKLCLDIDLFDKWQKAGNGAQSCESLADIANFNHKEVLSEFITLMVPLSPLLMHYRAGDKASCGTRNSRRSGCKYVPTNNFLQRAMQICRRWHKLLVSACDYTCNRLVSPVNSFGAATTSPQYSIYSFLSTSGDA